MDDPDIDESAAVAAALSKDPASGSVGLSRKPVVGDGDAAAAPHREGLG
ncbi:hypothetical protein [Microbacterium schleiferi]|uniref:Uncharacterized protein n=1 Tax=Microbacterium schleiferi TaxID=69362 RepID=A0ABU7V4I0_9MICO